MEPDFYPKYFELEGRHWWFLGRRRIFIETLRRFGPPAPLRALDFGCGTGVWLEHLKRLGEVEAVDGDAAAVAFCHQRGHTEVRHVPAGAPLPFADASFDLVTTFDVLEHIEDDAAAARELRRVLRPGGILVVAVPAFPILWGDQDEISRHFRRYRASVLAGRLEQSGLAVRHYSYFNTLLFAPIAAVRLIRRVLRAPSKEKTDFTIGGRASNAVLARLFALEARVVPRVRVPFGVSLLVVARRESR